MGKLQGKVAIITGAQGGMGQAQAHEYAAQGALLVLTDLAAGAEPAGNDGTLTLRMDVTSAEDWARVVAVAVDRFGRVDVLVNNAGYYLPRGMMETTAQDMERHFAVNQLGAFLGMQAVAPAMQAGGGGAIVNISSGAGLRGYPGMFAYSASKWAIRGMTKCASADLAGFGIRVNSIHPGAIDTDMLRSNDPAMLSALEAMIPLGHRRGQPEDVARISAFLASNDARYITGAEVAVDGGISA